MSVYGIGPSMSVSAIPNEAQSAPNAVSIDSFIVSDAVTVEISEKAKRLSQYAGSGMRHEGAEAQNPNHFGQALRVLFAAGVDINQ